MYEPAILLRMEWHFCYMNDFPVAEAENCIACESDVRNGCMTLIYYFCLKPVSNENCPASDRKNNREAYL